jgi:hypothetical protein
MSTGLPQYIQDRIDGDEYHILEVLEYKGFGIDIYTTHTPNTTQRVRLPHVRYAIYDDGEWVAGAGPWATRAVAAMRATERIDRILETG